MRWSDLSKRSNELNSGRSFNWPEMTPQDWLMEIMSLLGLVAMLFYVFYHYPKLPGSIPDHFDFNGNPQTFGDRNQVWIIPIISLFMYAMLPNIMRFRLSYPSQRFLNRVQTQKQFTGRVRLLRYQKMIMIWGLFYISFSLIRFSLHTGNGLGVWFFPVFLGLILIPSISFLLFRRLNR